MGLLQTLLPTIQYTQTVPLQVHSKFRLVMNYTYELELSRTFLSKYLEVGNTGLFRNEDTKPEGFGTKMESLSGTEMILLKHLIIVVTISNGW